MPPPFNVVEYPPIGYTLPPKPQRVKKQRKRAEARLVLQKGIMRVPGLTRSDQLKNIKISKFKRVRIST